MVGDVEAQLHQARFDLDDLAINQYELPSGLYGQSAIYTVHAHHVAVMRRLLLRMSSSG